MEKQAAGERRRLVGENPKVVGRYVKMVVEMVKWYKIADRVRNFKEEWDGEGYIEEKIVRYEKFDKQFREVQLRVEKVCGRGRGKRKWSPEFSKRGERVRHWRKRHASMGKGD